MTANSEKRARAVARAWEKTEPGSTLAVTTGDGREVHIEELVIEGDTVTVQLSGSPMGGDPAFVIVNPPTLVQDPMGDRVIDGMRFREDPLGAIAAVIAQHGGAAQKSRKRGRQ